MYSQQTEQSTLKQLGKVIIRKNSKLIAINSERLNSMEDTISKLLDIVSNLERSLKEIQSKIK